jgi:hypothetical protein
MVVIRKSVSLAMCTAVLLSAGASRAASPAADFASADTVIVSVDNLMPVFDFNSITENANGAKTTSTTTSLGVVTSGLAGIARIGSFHDVPRLGFDYVLGPGITIGGSAWVFADVSASQSFSAGGTSMSQDQPKATYWGIGPRVGFAYALGENWAIWPRLGIDYADLEIGSVTNNNVTSSGGSVNQLSLDLDGLLVWTPVHHFGITMGPTGSIPLTGKDNSNTTINGVTMSTSNDLSMWHFAVVVGLLGYI